ncbi:putative uncharacterized protein [Roseburia sp. CAG:303]|nr:putative uncharacterized protein [Roseburia sp. CAG:303]
MNKRMRNMLVLSGVCVLCFAGYGISVAMQKDTSQEEEKSEKLFAVSADDITQITYNWQEEEIALEKDGNDWQYKEDAAFSLNQTMAETMSEALSGAEVLQKIEEKDVDLQSFGLETPALAVTFSDGDGQQYQLSFGNYNTAAKGYYAMKNDDGCVYMVDSETMTDFEYGLYDLLVLDEIPSVDADYVSGITISDSGKTTEYTYQIEEVQEETTQEETSASQVVWYAWDGTDKVRCDSTEFAELTDEILKISASNAADYNAGSAEKLSETYGIADRMITVNYVDADTDEDKSYTLHFGSSDGAGNVYMTVDDSMQVQLVEESLVNSIFGEGN